MSGRTLVMLLIACLVVGGVILLFEADRNDSETTPALLALSRDAIDELTVEAEGDS